MINQRLMEMQVPIRGGQVHFREVLLHITRHLMGLSADDPITKSATKSLEVETAALVRRGGSLRDEYVGIVTRAKSVGKSHGGAAAQPASPRGPGSDGPVYATNQLVAAQRIQRRWVQVRPCSGSLVRRVALTLLFVRSTLAPDTLGESWASRSRSRSRRGYRLSSRGALRMTRWPRQGITHTSDSLCASGEMASVQFS